MLVFVRYIDPQEDQIIMRITPVSPFSVHLRPDIRDRLNEYHRRTGFTRRLIVEQALERWLDVNEPLLPDDRKGAGA